MTATDLNEMILAGEEGAARVQAGYSPDIGRPNRCAACDGELVIKYVPLGLNIGVGEPVWLHIGPCHQKFVDNRRLAAERKLGFGD